MLLIFFSVNLIKLAKCLSLSLAEAEVRFFVAGTSNTNVRLRSRRANNNGLCSFCGHDEDVVHLFLACPRAQSFWSLLPVNSSSVSTIEHLWSITLPSPALPNQKLHSTIITCLLWNVWKCRNAKVFNNVNDSNGDIFRRCGGDLLLWANRANSAPARLCLDKWSSFLRAM